MLYPINQIKLSKIVQLKNLSNKIFNIIFKYKFKYTMSLQQIGSNFLKIPFKF